MSVTSYLKTQIDALITGAKSRANHTGTQSADTLTDGTTNRLYSSTEKTKLAGVAPAATANRTDAATDVLLAAKADLVGGLVPTSQLPALSLVTAIPVASRTAMLALTSAQVQPGDVAVDTSTGSTRGTYMLLGADPSQLTNWLLLNAPTDVVGSVNGQQGTVVLAAADVGAAPAALSDVVVGNTTAIGQLSLSGTPVSLTGSGTMTAGRTNLLDGTSGALTATLPTPARVGQLLVAERVDTSTNLINFGGTVRGVAAVANMPGLGVAGEAFLFVAESLTSWRIAATHKPNALLAKQYDALGAAAAVTATSIGLGSVNNTADADKPVSTVQQTALNGKASLAAIRSAATRRLGIGVPAVTGAYLTASATAQTATGTSRIPYIVGVTGTAVRLTFTNWYSNASTYVDTDNTASIAVKASIERGGVLYPVTFGGKLTATIDGGGMVTSDPLAVDLTAGETLYVRTFITPTSNWYFNHYSYMAAGTGGWVATNDLTAPGSAAVADTASKALYGPSAITVEPTGATRLAVQAIGDSIGYGAGDGQGTQYTGTNTTNNALAGGGWIARALAGIGGLLQSAYPGDALSNWVTQAARFRRAALIDAAPVFLCQYGRNDLTGGRTTAAIQADMLATWAAAANRGKLVIQSTITPKSSTTDGWILLANQTVTANAGEANRVPLNQWLRAGAPVLNGAAAAVGAAGAITAGQAGHPLTSVYDAAAAVESAQDSGLFKPMIVNRSVSDAATTASSSTVTSSTANFTSADLGRQIVIPGAGASSAALVATITTINSTTSVTVNSTATNAVSAATATIGQTYTADGTHPTNYAAAQIATGFATALTGLIPAGGW